MNGNSNNLNGYNGYYGQQNNQSRNNSYSNNNYSSQPFNNVQTGLSQNQYTNNNNNLQNMGNGYNSYQQPVSTEQSTMNYNNNQQVNSTQITGLTPNIYQTNNNYSTQNSYQNHSTNTQPVSTEQSTMNYNNNQQVNSTQVTGLTPNTYQTNNNYSTQNSYQNLSTNTQPVSTEQSTMNYNNNQQVNSTQVTGLTPNSYQANNNYSTQNSYQNHSTNTQPVSTEQSTMNYNNNQQVNSTQVTGLTPNSYQTNNNYSTQNSYQNLSTNTQPVVYQQTNNTGTNIQSGGASSGNTSTFSNPGVYKVNNGQIYQVPSSMMNNQPNNSKFKKIGIVAAIVVLILLVIGLFSDEDSKKNSPNNRSIDYDRTIMIYMVGSNLESDSAIATADLNGLDYDKLNAQNTKVLLLAGGCPKWHNDYIDVNSTSIYELTPNGFQIVKNQSKRNMGLDTTLSDFLTYVYDNYSSKNYDLMLWNHGGAIIGSEYDNLFGDDPLSPKEITTALAKSPFSKDNKLELVIFRTCLNGTIEIADTFKDYANYLVASEEVTRGYSFNSVFTSLNDFNKNDSAIDIGKKFIDGYMDYINALSNTYGQSSSTIYSTYSLIDLTKITELETSVGDFFSSINLSQNYNYIAGVRSRLLQYGDDVKLYDMVDLYNLVNELKTLSNDKAVKVLNNISAAVVYLRAPDSRSKGLSIYFPYNGTQKDITTLLNNYYEYPSLSNYKTFIQSFYSIQSGKFDKLSFNNNSVKVSKDTESADFELELTDEQVKNFARAGYIVFRKEKDGYFLPIYSSGKSAKLEGNTLKANIKDRQLKAVDVSDKTEEIATLIEQNETDDYITYRALITLEDFKDEDPKKWKIDGASMTLILDKKTGKVTMGEVKKDNKDSIYDSSIVNLDEYTYIVVASSSYKILDNKGNYIDDWESNGIIKGLEVKVKDISFELQNYNDGYEYYAIFKIWDTHNNEYYSKLVKMK